jgi:hypothetical protein
VVASESEGDYLLVQGNWSCNATDLPHFLRFLFIFCKSLRVGHFERKNSRPFEILTMFFLKIRLQLLTGLCLSLTPLLAPLQVLSSRSL